MFIYNVEKVVINTILRKGSLHTEFLAEGSVCVQKHRDIKYMAYFSKGK